MSDATVVTRGSFRFRAAVEWTRIDGVFGPDGSPVLPRGSTLSYDLTTATLPLLSTGESIARILAEDNSLAFNAGRLATSVDSRIATVPLSAEYGLTSRITLGAVIPIVQSRSVVTTQLNGPLDSVANVGTNPFRFHGSISARDANAAVTNALTAARDQLSQRITTCTAAPTSAGCPAFNARQAEASALVSTTSTFAVGIATLYGISDDVPGAVFVPITGSPIQTAVDARLAALRASYTSFGISAGSGALAAAQASAANAQFQRLISDPDFGIEADSLGTTEQTAIGDIELSATAMLFNSFGATRGLRMRAAAAGVVRLGTGHPARANRPYDVPTGDGQMDIEGRAAVDALIGSRVLTTVAGTFTLQTGSVETTRLPYAPGDIFALDAPVAGSTKLGNMASVRINPRFLITPAVMVGALGVASFRAADEVTLGGLPPAGATFGGESSMTVYSGGLTISYSNLASASGVGSRAFPAEFVYSHIETLSASGAGAQKGYRDAIEVRVYLRTRR